MTLFATHYTTPDSERASHGDSEYVYGSCQWYSKNRKFRFQGRVPFRPQNLKHSIRNFQSGKIRVFLAFGGQTIFLAPRGGGKGFVLEGGSSRLNYTYAIIP